MKNPFEEYPVIAFEDIQKGDTIAFLTNYKGDTFTNASFGVADALHDKSVGTPSWRTAENWVVAWDEKGNTIHLIDRPKRSLPTDTGSTILITKYNGVVLEEPLVAMLDQYGDWFLPKGEDNSAVHAVWLCGVNEKADIEEWTLAEVKEVTV